eukprot:jgi/Galph1/3388/GphlegSOOS_G2041.1
MKKEKLYEELEKYFGHDSFRPLQKEVIESLLGGRDVFFLAPTGGGKSLCYQLPALMLKTKISFVVSPLIALIENQVEELTRKNMKAYSILSFQGKKYKERVFSLLEAGEEPEAVLVYTTPETLSTERIQNTISSLYRRDKIGIFAVDEAHCISNWGHDFRPKYRKLKILKELCPKTPILALTATATKIVIDDIIGSLALKNFHCYRQSFNRPNIFYQVVDERCMHDNIMDDILTFIWPLRNCSGIIYARQRLETENIANRLVASGIQAAAYHAGKKVSEKQKVLKDWLSNNLQVICCTVAFGMGIDKPDVRFVIHFNLPKNLENFYQESGRAGRDGLPSCSRLYFSLADFSQLESISKGKEYMPSDYLQSCSNGLEGLLQYCKEENCRRRQLLRYFGDDFSGICDFCDLCVLSSSVPISRVRSAEASNMKLLFQQSSEFPLNEIPSQVTDYITATVLKTKVSQNHVSSESSCANSNRPCSGFRLASHYLETSNPNFPQKGQVGLTGQRNGIQKQFEKQLSATVSAQVDEGESATNVYTKDRLRKNKRKLEANQSTLSHWFASDV